MLLAFLPLLPSRQYQEALENYSNINQQVKCLKRFIQVLCKIMDDRHRVYTELRR